MVAPGCTQSGEICLGKILIPANQMFGKIDELQRPLAQRCNHRLRDGEEGLRPPAAAIEDTAGPGACGPQVHRSDVFDMNEVA